MNRILIFGNSGSGKTTMARGLAEQLGIAHLDLDTLAWGAPGSRRPVEDSIRDVLDFVAKTEDWVIEGCYGDLIEAAVPFCTELRFLDPGIEECVENCRRRPWEPEKYDSLEDQNAVLDFLIEWVRQYESRTDEFSRVRHRAIFDAFPGRKRIFPEPADVRS